MTCWASLGPINTSKEEEEEEEEKEEEEEEEEEVEDNVNKQTTFQTDRCSSQPEKLKQIDAFKKASSSLAVPL